jgi:hypothetical protein
MTDAATPPLRQSKPKPAPVKQVRLKLAYVDLWSAVKVSSLVAVVVSVSLLVVNLMLWGILSATGILGALQGIVTDVLGEGGSAIIALTEFSQVFGLSMVSFVINLVSITVLGSLGTVVYNLIAKLTGGLLVGFHSN